MATILVTGSRCGDKYTEKIEYYLAQNIKMGDVVLHGGAWGVDEIAQNWCRKNHIKTYVYKPNYKKHGRSAPLVRNIEMIRASNRTLAIWDGKSRGTLYTINHTKKHKKPVTICKLNDQLIQTSLKL